MGSRVQRPFMSLEIDLGFSVQFGIFGVKGWEATTTRLQVGGGTLHQRMLG